jgi:Tol biopolymer transport system component
MKKSGKLLVLSLVLLFAVVFLFGGCSTESSDTVTTGVTGIVKDASTNQPLPGVRVTVGTRHKDTDAQGKYSISADPGTYTLTAVKTGYAGHSQQVTVEADVVKTVDFPMTPTSGTATVTGTVSNYADGEPIVGAKVKIGSKETETTADGAYTLEHVPAGSTLITATAGGQRDYETTVEITAGQEKKLDIEMLPESGRYQVFSSYSTNFDTTVYDESRQVYLRDIYKGTTILVSVNSEGVPASGNNCSSNRGTCASISECGRYVVFLSNAENLVDSSFSGYRQVYLKNMKTKAITLVSKGYDGRMANDCTGEPVISADGKYVVYMSYAYNIIRNVDTYGSYQIYRYDVTTDQNSLVSVAAPEAEELSRAVETVYAGDRDSGQPEISFDGRFVVFRSYATNLVEGFGGYSKNQVFIRDMDLNVTTLVSEGFDSEGKPVLANRGCARPTVSADGKFVVFRSWASNLVDGVVPIEYTPQLFLRDMEKGETTLVSVGLDEKPGTSESTNPQISADGRYVVFSSYAQNLVLNQDNGYSKIYVRDLQELKTSVVTVGFDGSQADNDIYNPLISADGRYVFFRSYARNLINSYTNGEYQVYRQDLQAEAGAGLVKVSLNSEGVEGNGDSYLRTYFKW